MNEYCKYRDKCYFMKDIIEEMDRKQEQKGYLDSCNLNGKGCELAKLSNIEFKMFERLDKEAQKDE